MIYRTMISHCADTQPHAHYTKRNTTFKSGLLRVTFTCLRMNTNKHFPYLRAIRWDKSLFRWSGRWCPLWNTWKTKIKHTWWLLCDKEFQCTSSINVNAICCNLIIDWAIVLPLVCSGWRLPKEQAKFLVSDVFSKERFWKLSWIILNNSVNHNSTGLEVFWYLPKALQWFCLDFLVQCLRRK